jgi:hypothetical protein
MNELCIDRLILRVPGLSESEGRRLALRVSQGLSAAKLMAGGREIPVVRLDLKRAPSMDIEAMARHIVAELLQQVRRLP